jgi:hypothetical protein
MPSLLVISAPAGRTASSAAINRARSTGAKVGSSDTSNWSSMGQRRIVLLRITSMGLEAYLERSCGLRDRATTFILDLRSRRRRWRFSVGKSADDALFHCDR